MTMQGSFLPLREALFRMQDRLATLLGCAVDRRALIVASMLERGPAEVTGYWAQLLIAAAIATLGLVLGSTAVIIGAMLVAPLMGPIVGLGMGLASGSPVLVFRSASRVVASVTAVATLATVLTRLLPFHQLNAEIAARATPTALDLGTAVFCAMAGVFAALRPSSDVATTAAGTSIGISLVPPLCVCGYGLGTNAPSLAYGAGLLFLTNFSAIVFIASVGFAATGFGQSDVAEIEREALDRTPDAVLARPAMRRATASLRSLGGPFLRLAMPVMLLAALYSPLRRGLDEVAWQISARERVASAIAAVPHRVVQSTVVVERRQVRVVIFMLGSHAEATAARQKLGAIISSSTGVTPLVEVHAVPDATDFEALEQATRLPDAPALAIQAAAPPPPEPEPMAVFELGMAELKAVVERRWPQKAGTLLRIDVGADVEPRRLRLLYAGAPLSDASIELLQGALTDELGADLVLELHDIPSEPVEMDVTDPATVAWLAARVETSRWLGSTSVCLTVPEQPARAREPPDVASFRRGVDAILARHPRVFRTGGTKLSVRFTTGSCWAPATPP